MYSMHFEEPEIAPDKPHTFQVDLRGLVDLLSHHLYSSPRVFLRELLQNAVDALTERRAHQPDAPAQVRIHADGTSLRITDTGIGLTETEVHTLLATIGRSSKRDAAHGLETARTGFLGRFGIGLLACFVVAREIRVVSRSARTPDAPPVEWRAHDDGSYTVRTLPPGEHPDPGTTVHLTARPGTEEWLTHDRVLTLARDFGSLLPHDIRVADQPVTDLPAPWDRTHPSPAARRAALATHCESLFGFRPLDSIDLDLPLVGLRGIAHVVPWQVSPTHRADHRVHLKGMLLTERADGLLPDWAYFVRCVLDTDTLRPTASRESLAEDEALAGVREALGRAVRDRLAELAATDPERLGRLLAVHHLGVKSLARHDDGILAALLPWLPFETTDGRLSLDEFARRHRVVHFTRTVEEFRQVAAIAAAQGVGLVNGGHPYACALVERLPHVRPGTVVAELDTDTVTDRLGLLPPGAEPALADLLAVARTVLDAHRCDVVVRAYRPVTLPALHLDAGSARPGPRAGAEERARHRWGTGNGDAPHDDAPRARLVLNHNHPLVRRIATLDDPQLTATAVEALYGQALLTARRPLRPVDHALLDRSFLALLDRAVRPPAGDAVADSAPGHPAGEPW
ncbi:HSP90 family protein [Streptomyces sp. NPDC101158]|uniref:HSP90 family protein n=1 Tax=Streptomyces sp. NPDC101158 TaxID=3366117 RepID=UPI00380981A2